MSEMTTARPRRRVSVQYVLNDARAWVSPPGVISIRKQKILKMRPLPRWGGISLLMPLANEITRSEEHTSELQSPDHLVCRLLLEKKKNKFILKYHNTNQ